MLTNISGFPEFLPRDQIAFNRVVSLIKEIFEQFGFSPLDTPAVEKVSTLLAKGNDHEIYGVHRLTDPESAHKKELALRFDLTVPLARYVAQHYDKLTFPYRRYHIAPVWRGERAQAGRYRQFYQCDIDIIGEGDLSLLHDAEILNVLYRSFRIIGIERFIIKVNNRLILTGLIKGFGVAEDQLINVMRLIDKADKITTEALQTELAAEGLNQKNIAVLLDLIAKPWSNVECLQHLANLSQSEEFHKGLRELQEVIAGLRLFGIPDAYLQIDPSLARGLTYYTGTVFEVKLLDHPELGSVGGGGRYANLAESFTNKKLPGVGASIGISRLLPYLIETGLLSAIGDSPARILVTTQYREGMKAYIELAQTFRQAGIKTELYLAEKPLSAQMKYAGKKGFALVVIADRAELESGQMIVRQMKTGEQRVIKQIDWKQDPWLSEAGPPH